MSGTRRGVDPAALAHRLRAAGCADVMMAEDNGLVRVQVNDPDGQRLEIHPAV